MRIQKKTTFNGGIDLDIKYCDKLKGNKVESRTYQK